MSFLICKDCGKRHPACHDSCEIYMVEKQKDADVKKRRKNERQFDNFAIERAIKEKDSFNKKKGR